MVQEKISTVKSAKNQFIRREVSHDSAKKHVSGEAVYIDDILDYPQQLHVCFCCSTECCAKIKKIEFDSLQSMEGVIDIIQAKDVIGKLDIAPVFDGDPLLADGKVDFLGQPILAVAATSMAIAREAVKKIKIEYSLRNPVLTIKKALKKEEFILDPQIMEMGNANLAIQKAKHKIAGEFLSGAQDHFYLETQVALAVPKEDGVLIYSSTQNPTEIQKLAAEVLDIKMGSVVVETRRMGGGFGGKETQAAQSACTAALLAYRNKRPVKVRLSRYDDMVTTGKRHNFYNNYIVAFNNDGLIDGIKINLAAQCGYSADLSAAIIARAMFHSDNCYYLKHVKITGYACKSNTVSNTAFRGFGGPQGMLMIENIIDEIARYLNKDPLEIRKLNFYNPKKGRNITHYNQKIEDFFLEDLVLELELDSQYQKRKSEIAEFNQNSPILKKGIALSPLKFGISFTVIFMNQAGALIHIYSDGTIHLNHGGTEMGQGLFTKVAQIVANEFQVSLDKIQISATRTDKVPNTSPTAASAGTDLNGKAAQIAAQTIKKRLFSFAAKYFQVSENDVLLKNNGLWLADKKKMSFTEFIDLAHKNRVQLSSTGFYKTPKIYFDKATNKGNPFFYFAYGASVSEVIVDSLTGEYKVLRVDILHDVGNSINLAIDRGQVEGGFIQGMGWLTTEEVSWDLKTGRLLTTGPDTYKIPTIYDLPQDFRVKLKNISNKADTVYNSKAVGEPPLMLANSVWLAIKDAIFSLAKGNKVELNAPATPVEVFRIISKLKNK